MTTLFFACSEKDIQFSLDEVNFGDVKPVSVHEKLFYLRNLSGFTVSIDSIYSGCSCTKVELEDQFIKPFDSIEVYLRFESRNRPGNMVKSFTVYEKNSALTCSIRCNVLSNF
ncbi:MAG: DUF1573 domain-containing protein [Candidatus Delongbacteria bacterium]|nr:DUF1573 domain-containing protein [Candidatus Delongbacteria bacterium]